MMSNGPLFSDAPFLSLCDLIVCSVNVNDENSFWFFSRNGGGIPQRVIINQIISNLNDATICRKEGVTHYS